MIFERLRAPERDVFREVRERGARRGRDELGAGDACACARTAATTSATVVRVWSSMFVETWTCSAAAGPSARTSSVLRSALRDRLGGLERRVDLDVERDQRRPRGDERGARGGVRRGGPKSGVKCCRPPGRRSSRARPPARELAVEVDGDAELPELVGEHERLGARRAALSARVEVDDRRDVDGAHARVDARDGV